MLKRKEKIQFFWSLSQRAAQRTSYNPLQEIYVVDGW